jgi:hypothetical protein
VLNILIIFIPAVVFTIIGRNINTWSWNITQPEDFVSRLVVTNQDRVMATEIDTLLILSSGNISFLHGISGIGTKFSTAEEEGPRGRKNIFDTNNEPMKGTLYFRFGE